MEHPTSKVVGFRFFRKKCVETTRWITTDKIIKELSQNWKKMGQKIQSVFIFCLKKRDFKVDDFKAEAEVTIARNDKGFLRIKKIDVYIEPRIEDPDTLKRAKQCLKAAKDGVSFFEQYCIVTQSVRSGIKVNVNIDL